MHVMTHEIPAAERIRKARTSLLLDHPFFGSLLFRLKSEECRSIPTMATNGVVLRYNPAFVDTLNAATLAGVLAHEVMHPALQHHTRRAKRDPRRWNEACDYAINPLLLDAGLSLPDDVLVDPRFRGMSAEQIYNLREAEAQPESDEQSESEPNDDLAGNPAGCGDDAEESQVPESSGGVGQVIDAPETDEGSPSVEEQVRDWNIAVNQAATLASRPARFPPVSSELLKARRKPRSIGGNCCAVSGPTLSRPIRVGCGPTAVTSGPVSICPALCAKARAKSRLPSIARDQSMHGSCDSSRRRSVPSSKASGRSGCMFSTSTPRFRRLIPTRPARCSISIQSVAAAPISVPASTGSMSTESAHKQWSF